tara:strand:- start:2749 stop:2940 length:192 start_codon:yes stop_codon:yes gene_type:complete
MRDQITPANAVSAQEAAAIMGLHVNTIYRYIKNHQLEAIVIGPRSFFVTNASIAAFKKGRKYA